LIQSPLLSLVVLLLCPSQVFTHTHALWVARWCHTWAIFRAWLNKLYPNSSSEGQNDCAVPRYLLYFHGTFYARLAERGQTDNISSRWSHARSRGDRARPFVQGITHVTSDRTLRSNLAIFSFPPAGFTSAASVVKKILQRVDWAYFFGKFCSGSYFQPKQKNL